MAILSLINVFIFAITLYLTRYVYWEATTGSRRRTLKKTKGCLPAKQLPSKDPFFGLDHVIDGWKAFSNHNSLEQGHRQLLELGVSTLETNILGKKIFVTNDAENVRSLLQTNFNSWSLGQERMDGFRAFMGEGVFSTEGAKWKHSREMLRPCFERSQVADFSILERHTQELIDIIPRDGSTIDLQEPFHRFTSDTATEFLFGEHTNTIENTASGDPADKFVKACDYCLNPLAQTSTRNFWGFLLFITGLLPYLDPRFKQSVKTINDYADTLVSKGITRHTTPSTSQTARYIFLDKLISQTSNKTAIRSELLNILFAGRDTTASLLSNTWHTLSQNPSIFSRVRSEIATVCGSNPPTYANLTTDLRYLRAVLNESQRLYPVVPSNARHALRDTWVPRGGGARGEAPVFVPKGAMVNWNLYSMHRRKDVFGEDAELFRPERWMLGEGEGEGKGGLRPGWGFLPFNAGPRGCIGQQFALTEASYVTVRLIQTFPKLESRDPEPWREKLTISCTGLGGCKVALGTEV